MKTLACTLSLAIVTALVGCSAEAPKPATPPATSMPGADHVAPTTPPGGEPAAAEGEKKEGDAAAPAEAKPEGEAAAPAEPEKKPE
jgi:hypothetical protein